MHFQKQAQDGRDEDMNLQISYHFLQLGLHVTPLLQLLQNGHHIMIIGDGSLVVGSTRL